MVSYGFWAHWPHYHTKHATMFPNTGNSPHPMSNFFFSFGTIVDYWWHYTVVYVGIKLWLRSSSTSNVMIFIVSTVHPTPVLSIFLGDALAYVNQLMLVLINHSNRVCTSSGMNGCWHNGIELPLQWHSNTLDTYCFWVGDCSIRWIPSPHDPKCLD